MIEYEVKTNSSKLMQVNFINEKSLTEEQIQKIFDSMESDEKFLLILKSINPTANPKKITWRYENSEWIKNNRVQ